jgi:hypothetical protein
MGYQAGEAVRHVLCNWLPWLDAMGAMHWLKQFLMCCLSHCAHSNMCMSYLSWDAAVEPVSRGDTRRRTQNSCKHYLTNCCWQLIVCCQFVCCFSGVFPPGLQLGAKAFFQCGHNQLLAHAKAVQLYRQKYYQQQKGQLSLAVRCCADITVLWDSSCAESFVMHCYRMHCCPSH